jgi:hypothetical protein
MLGDEDIYSEDDDETFALTTQGLEQCTDIHYRFEAGESIEEIADDYGLELLAVQIMMVLFYQSVDQFGIQL